MSNGHYRRLRGTVFLLQACCALLLRECFVDCVVTLVHCVWQEKQPGATDASSNASKCTEMYFPQRFDGQKSTPASGSADNNHPLAERSHEPAGAYVIQVVLTMMLRGPPKFWLGYRAFGFNAMPVLAHRYRSGDRLSQKRDGGSAVLVVVHPAVNYYVCAGAHAQPFPLTIFSANGPDQRPGATDRRLSTRAAPQGSLHLAC